MDFGSGAGFPGIPIALIRQEIAVTLADSQNKKVAFLREVVRSLDLPVPVHSGRVETLAPLFGCVTLRAVDNMARALPAAIQRLQPQGWLAIMTTAKEIPALTEVALPGATIAWNDPLPLPRNTDRVLLLGQIA